MLSQISVDQTSGTVLHAMLDKFLEFPIFTFNGYFNGDRKHWACLISPVLLVVFYKTVPVLNLDRVWCECV